jgi:hypothetical protein
VKRLGLLILLFVAGSANAQDADPFRSAWLCTFTKQELHRCANGKCESDGGLNDFEVKVDFPKKKISYDGFPAKKFKTVKSDDGQKTFYLVDSGIVHIFTAGHEGRQKNLSYFAPSMGDGSSYIHGFVQCQ